VDGDDHGDEPGRGEQRREPGRDAAGIGRGRCPGIRNRARRRGDSGRRLVDARASSGRRGLSLVDPVPRGEQ